MPFHIKINIVRHVELQNAVGTLMNQPQERELEIPIIQNRSKGMELGNQLRLHSQQICPYVHIRSKEPEVYSHPHSTPQKIPMGNHRLKHCWTKVNTTSPRVSEVIAVETQK